MSNDIDIGPTVWFVVCAMREGVKGRDRYATQELEYAFQMTAAIKAENRLDFTT